MRTSRAAAETGLTMRALRYYEARGLVVPTRHGNGYRDYRSEDVRLLRELKSLLGLGLTVDQARPFLACLSTGHARADECPASLAAYRDAITDLDARIAELTTRRAALLDALRAAATRDRAPGTDPRSTVAPDPYTLPENLPVPADDGAADHLPGRALPALALTATGGGTVALDALGVPGGRVVLYFYPLTGRPDVDLPTGWDTIPGARGCTVEACGFRDHHGDLCAAGADAVYGVSAQTTGYQREVADRLGLPFPLLADPSLAVADALALPTLHADGHRLYTRLTLVVRDGTVEHAFYPVFPPDTHAEEVLAWLRANP